MFSYFGKDPDFSFGHFFANPIQITSTGPTKIADVCKPYRSVCDRASSFSDMVRRGEDGKARNYRLLPLCRAILKVLVEISPIFGARISLGTEVQRQIVLLLRTRDEDGLSAPIKFDATRSQSLPQARSDINAGHSGHVI